MNEITALIKGDMGEHSVKTIVYKPGCVFSSDTEPASTRSQGFPASRIVGSKCLFKLPSLWYLV